MPESARRRRIRWALSSALALAALGAGAWFGERSWRAKFEFQAAQRAFDRHDLDEARAHLDRCQRIWKKEPQVHLLAARIARRAGDEDKADEYLKAYQRSPKQSDELLILERLLMRAQSGTLSMEQENYLRERAGMNGPEAPLIYEALAEGAVLNHQHNDGLESYSQLLELRPNDEAGLFQRGELLLRMGLLEDATGDFERIVRLHSERDDARLRLGQVLVRRGKALAEEAALHFEYLNRRQPDNPEVIAGLAESRLLTGQDTEAAQLLDAALERNPDERKLLLPRARLALDQGEVSKAESWLRRLLHQTPLDYPANQLLLRCLETQGKKADAKECVQHLKSIETENRRLGGLLQQLRFRSFDANLRHEIAQIFMRKGEEKEAEQWFQSALRFDPNHQPSQHALAEYHSRKRAARVN